MDSNCSTESVDGTFKPRGEKKIIFLHYAKTKAQIS